MTITDIDETLKDLSHCVRNKKLHGLEAIQTFNKKVNQLIPERFLGGFAAACHVNGLKNEFGKEKDGALRIWTKKIDGIKERSKIVSTFLKTKKSKEKYFYDYDYIPQALNVGGEDVDVILMDWIKGQTLYKFIESNLDKPENIIKVADKCLEMFKWMRTNKIAHGDLQHDNIIVDSKFNIHLCDYDSVCVPGIEGKKIVTPGLQGYQHPLRFTEKNLVASLDDDFFSEVVIYAGLYTIAANPKIWNHDDNNEPYLIFSDIDFKKIRNGETPSTLEKISKIQNDKVSELTKLLLQNIKCDKLSEIKTLDEVAMIGIDRTDNHTEKAAYTSAPTDTMQTKSNKVDKPAPQPKKNTTPSQTDVCPRCKSPLTAKDYLYCHFCNFKISRPFPFKLSTK